MEGQRYQAPCAEPRSATLLGCGALGCGAVVLVFGGAVCHVTTLHHQSRFGESNASIMHCMHTPCSLCLDPIIPVGWKEVYREACMYSRKPVSPYENVVCVPIRTRVYIYSSVDVFYVLVGMHVPVGMEGFVACMPNTGTSYRYCMHDTCTRPWTCTRVPVLGCTRGIEYCNTGIV